MKSTIDMAREAGFEVGKVFVDGVLTDAATMELKAFEALVRADERNRTWTQEHWTEYEQAIVQAEREACAKVCEDVYTGEEASCDWPTPEMCAAAIRARGETK